MSACTRNAGSATHSSETARKGTGRGRSCGNLSQRRSWPIESGCKISRRAPLQSGAHTSEACCVASRRCRPTM
eukprot:scaffold2141_cov282-Pinguiococcus_pyrenoidosus.AAC.20